MEICPSMGMKSHLKEHFHNAMPIWTFFVITLFSSFFPSNWIKNIKIKKAYKWSSKEIYIPQELKAMSKMTIKEMLHHFTNLPLENDILMVGALSWIG